MLRNTFLHIPGVGRQTERKLWDQGCSCWDDLIREPNRWSCGTVSRACVQDHLAQSVSALDKREPLFFRSSLGAREAWRAFPEFRDSCAYLDIETDGSASTDGITTIGLFDGKEFRVFIKGKDLDRFPAAVSDYSLVVTFFGTGFDLPALQKRFDGLRFDQIHIDLCPVLKQLGHRGGLKRIEKQVGIRRSPETDGLTGYDAVLLWRRFAYMGDQRALDRLVAYNREDVVNLERLAEFAYQNLKRQVFETPVAQ